MASARTQLFLFGTYAVTAAVLGAIAPAMLFENPIVKGIESITGLVCIFVRDCCLSLTALVFPGPHERSLDRQRGPHRDSRHAHARKGWRNHSVPRHLQLGQARTPVR